MKRISVFTVKQVRESNCNYELLTKKVSSPQSANSIIQAVLDLESKTEENFGILTLNTKNDVVGVHSLTRGSLNSCIVHPREVFKAAILNNAATIICFHNHPSGDPTPSPEDIEMTKRLIEAGNIIGIEVLDHVITGHEGRFVSLKEQGFF